MCCSIKAANVQGNLQQIQIISADYMQTNMARYKWHKHCKQFGLVFGSQGGVGAWCEYMGAQVGSTWWEYGGVQSTARHDSPRVTKGPKVSRILPVSFPGDEEGNMNMIFWITQLF